MATEQLYTVAGTSTHYGVTKVRFANDLISRIKVFSKNGCVANLVELPKPMTKLEALQYLSTHADFQQGDVNFAVQSKLVEKTREAKRGEIKIAGGSATIATTKKDTANA